MSVSSKLQNGFQKLLDKAGKQICIRRFNVTIGSVWDDDINLTSGTNFETWTSGIVLPIKGKFGSSESMLMEQGKLIDGDVKLFVSGNINFTGIGSYIIRVGIGSPPNIEYQPVPLGVIKQEVAGVDIYKKAYFRRILDTGSYLGEV